MHRQYRVVLVDDNEKEMQHAALLLKPYLESEKITLQVFPTLQAFESYCTKAASSDSDEGIDILFMDIAFGCSEQTGIDCVSHISQLFPGMQVIYLTGFIEYCTQVYETDHVYFLLKPLEKTQLDKALTKAFAALEHEDQAPLAIKTQGKVYQLFPEEIAFIESNRRKVVIHTLTNMVEAYASLSSMCERLPDNFVQCHKSFLVNLDLVKTFDAKTLHLTTGDQIPVSQTRIKETRRAFFERMTVLAD